MDRDVEGHILDELTAIRELLFDLVSRVAKLEGKYSWVAGIYGALGGLMSAIAIYLATRGG